MDMDGLTAGIDLPPNLHAPWAARRLVLTLLSIWNLAEPGTDGPQHGDGTHPHNGTHPPDGQLTLADVVELLTNEVVTNAVEHVGGTKPLHVLMHCSHGRLEVSVTDASTVLPVLRKPDTTNPRGRGMFLVNALAHRWGCEGTPAGKRVWYQLLTNSGTAAHEATQSPHPPDRPMG